MFVVRMEDLVVVLCLLATGIMIYDKSSRPFTAISPGLGLRTGVCRPPGSYNGLHPAIQTMSPLQLQQTVFNTGQIDFVGPSEYAPPAPNP